jgi:hypothetical protein
MTLALGPDMVGPGGESLLCATCPKRRRDEADPEDEPLVRLG